jgi:hypothetical protein
MNSAPKPSRTERGRRQPARQMIEMRSAWGPILP